MDQATKNLDRIGTASALHGRVKEQQKLLEYARSSLAGRCNCVFVSGPPGVGKSAFAGYAQTWFGGDKPGFIIRGKYDQFQQDVPYAAFVGAFRQLVDCILSLGGAELVQWKADIMGALGENGQAILSVVPDLSKIIGTQPALQPLAPSEERNRFLKTCRDFVAGVSACHHPLCLILDDLQWADAASLVLLKSILKLGSGPHLLIIATYRRDEYRNNGPLLEFLREAELQQYLKEEIRLGDLDEEATRNAVCDLLRCASTEIEPLARSVWVKTGGNPFYISRFLQALVEEGLLRFDPVDNCWAWHQDALERRAVTENIVEFLATELLKLPLQTQRFLSRAACVGTSFSLTKCWRALGHSEADVRILAEQSQVRGFLTIIAEAPGPAGVAGDSAAPPSIDLVVTFAHDRVQQAARHLFPAAELAPAQLEIGRRLRQSLPSGDGDRVAEEPILSSILNNLNDAADLIHDPREREQLAWLNLKSAERARRGLAYHEALNRVRTGLGLLTEDAWQTHYDTMYALCCHGFECAFLTGGFQEAEALFDLLIARAANNLHRARAWHTKVLLNTSLERYAEAIDVAISGLRAFKISMPRRPRPYHLLIELAKTQVLLRARKASDLIDLPPMSDPETLEAAKLLVAMVPPAYFLNQELFALLGLKVVNLSLRKGNSPMSPAGYVVYSLALTGVLGFPVTGWEFGKFAVDLAERYNIAAFTGKPLLIFAVFVNAWRKPWRSCDAILERALDACLKSSDMQYANYCIIGLGHHSFIWGDPVGPLLEYFSSNEMAVRENRDPFATETLLQWKQCAKAMMGETHAPSVMTDAQYDEDESESRIRKAGNSTLLAYLYIRKVFLESIAGDPVRALAIARRTKPLLRFTPGNLIVVDYHFWSGIAAARVLMRGFFSWRAKFFLRARRNTLRRFARYCPENFEHLAALLDAEVEALSSGDLRLYDHAIALAWNRGALHVAGTGNERAAEWHETRNNSASARGYYAAARKAYEAWGGKAKAQEMERRLQALDASDADRAPVIRRKTSVLDLAAALKSTEEMKGGIEAKTAELLKLALAVEPRARIALIATSDKESRLEALAENFGGEPRIEFAHSADAVRNFSRAVANTVRRTNGPVHLANPQNAERFARCPYLQEAKLALVHAIPIDSVPDASGAPRPNGVLSFELAAGDVDENTIGTIGLVGLGLNGIVRKHRLERMLSDVQIRLANMARFVPIAVQHHILDAADPSRWEKESKEVAVLLIDMDNYTRKCEDLKDQIVDLIQQYYSTVLDEVRMRGGDLCDMAGDGLMILFQGRRLSALAEAALESALAVRSRIDSLNERFSGQYPKVTVHVGVHCGVASVGPTKLEGIIENRWVYSATGPTVNLAARIGDLASDGSILISEESANLVRDRYAFFDLGSHELQNIKEPVRVLKLLTALPH